MSDERRTPALRDRRAMPRGGRRQQDAKKPWYMRRRLWLAAASVMYMSWRRLRAIARAAEQRNKHNLAA